MKIEWVDIDTGLRGRRQQVRWDGRSPSDSSTWSVPPGGDYSYFQLALLDKNNGKVKRDQHFWQKGALQTVSLGPFHQKETLATKITTRIKPKKKISSFILLTKNFPFGSSFSSVPPEGDISALLEQRKHHEKKTRSFDQKKPFRQFH